MKIQRQFCSDESGSAAGSLMNSLMTWICILMTMLFAAGVWFAYLVRIVLNDEVVQERKRRRMRARELERRHLEDKANKRARRR